MGDFKAVFMTVEGLEEARSVTVNLAASNIQDAEAEAQKLAAPPEANFVDLYCEGQKTKRIGVLL